MITEDQPRNLRTISLVKFTTYFLLFSLDTVEKFMYPQEKLTTYYCRLWVKAVGQSIRGNQVKLSRSFKHRRLSIAPDHINMITCSNQRSVDI